MEVDFPPEEPTKELLVAPKAAVELHQQTAAPEMLLKRCVLQIILFKLLFCEKEKICL